MRDAAGTGDVEMMRDLLEDGVDIEDGDEVGFTALMSAAAYDRSGRGIDFLLTRGADPRRRSDVGLTALSYAIVEGNVVAARRLVDFDAELVADAGDACGDIGISRLSTREEKRQLGEVLC